MTNYVLNTNEISLSDFCKSVIMNLYKMLMSCFDCDTSYECEDFDDSAYSSFLKQLELCKIALPSSVYTCIDNFVLNEFEPCKQRIDDSKNAYIDDDVYRGGYNRLFLENELALDIMRAELKARDFAENFIRPLLLDIRSGDEQTYGA